MLNYSQSNVLKSKQQIAVAWDIHNDKDNKWIKRYSHFSDIDQFQDLNLHEQHKNYYEMLTSNHPVRCGWDIEWYSFPDFPSYNPYIVLDGLLDYIIQTCEIVFQKPINKSHFKISD